MSAQIDHPDYYSPDTVEVIDVIQAWHLDFALGSALKYIVRAGRKPGARREDDLKKAIWYLNYAVDSGSVPLVNCDELVGASSLFYPERLMREWELGPCRCAAIVGIWNAMCTNSRFISERGRIRHLGEAISALEAELGGEGTESSETDPNP